MINKFITSTILATTLVGSSCVASTKVPEIDVSVNEDNAVAIEVIPVSQWTCPDCNPNEKYVLAKLQEYTNIKDRNSLATIMGNIKSESNFHSNICEGGARVPYERCYRGGYGLIQWTSIGRYRGLGNFAVKYNCNPSELDCQVRWMVNEPQFRKVLPEFEGSGQTIRQLMVPSYYWLGWGIKGYREQYAYDYTKRMVLE